MRSSPQRRWHLEEIFVKINGEVNYLSPPRLRRQGLPRRPLRI